MTSQGQPARCSSAVTYQPSVADTRSPTMFCVLSPCHVIQLHTMAQAVNAATTVLII